MNVKQLLKSISESPKTTRRNERGNQVNELFIDDCERSRYAFDYDLDKGWKQYDTDQDASYFGIWVNIAKRKTLTYAEGDLILVTCESDEHLKSELKAMEEFHGEPPPAFVAIGNDGVTNYYDNRPAV